MGRTIRDWRIFIRLPNRFKRKDVGDLMDRPAHTRFNVDSVQELIHEWRDAGLCYSPEGRKHWEKIIGAE